MLKGAGKTVGAFFFGLTIAGNPENGEVKALRTPPTDVPLLALLV